MSSVIQISGVDPALPGHMTWQLLKKNCFSLLIMKFCFHSSLLPHQAIIWPRPFHTFTLIIWDKTLHQWAGHRDTTQSTAAVGRDYLLDRVTKFCIVCSQRPEDWTEGIFRLRLCLLTNLAITPETEQRAPPSRLS